MKHLLLTTIGAVVLVGCGESQQSALPPKVEPAEPVAEAAQSESPSIVNGWGSRPAGTDHHG